ncbi:hypothetical protein Tco_0857869 [Tanacetum coccineum]|uniref:Uncharacterized protein n=1 Tax=Tanacetum coccineum TaxID=301880 RepID=A0ABQ5BAT3_9ASTR
MCSWRKKIKGSLFTTCHENGINQDLLNTFESSDDDTIVVNAPREPFVVKQDPGENSSQSPPQINHNCCYECGDSLDESIATMRLVICGNDSNKIYDPGICIEVESTRILAPLPPVIDTLLTFSSKNEDKVFNHGVLASKKKSYSSPSHRGLKAFQFSPESPMLIHGDNTPNLGVRHPHFYPP